METIITAYTDGSASVAGSMKGYAGFGTYFPDLFGQKKAFSAGFENGLTGQMEVLALLTAIKQMPLKDNIKLVVYSDSEYVVKTFTEGRLERWRKADWTNTSGEIKNKDLWIKIHKELKSRSHLKLEMKHIKSHQVEKEKNLEKRALLLKNPHIIGNSVVDKLADYKRHTKRFPDITHLKLLK
jgi:ribonuclease HI